MAFNYDEYVRTETIPHMWCPGCGIGIVMKAIIRAFTALQWDKNDIAFVSGIGCTSRMPGYMDMNTLHTTHGRALAFATGVKLAHPEKHVVVVGGDGDATAIGGNHLIHAARRNIDITLIINDNNIYGMTGGQYSPTTPGHMVASTAPYGMVEPNFDIAKLVMGAGATYVARETIAKGIMLEKYIRTGMAHKGFSVIVAESTCPIQFGRRNRLADPVELMHWVREHGVPKSKAARMEPEELQGKFVTGELFRDDSRPEFTEIYQQVIDQAMKKGE